MYRVIDTKGLFKILSNHNFGDQSCKLRLIINDNFFYKNKSSTLINFVNGIPHLKVKGNHEVEIHLGVSDFSSLIMGVVNFKSLYEYGLAKISNIKYLDTVNKIFLTEKKPICTTLF